jgi:hypothetical protein
MSEVLVTRCDWCAVTILVPRAEAEGYGWHLASPLEEESPDLCPVCFEAWRAAQSVWVSRGVWDDSTDVLWWSRLGEIDRVAVEVR